MNKLKTLVLSAFLLAGLSTQALADDAPSPTGYYLTGQAKHDPSSGPKYVVVHEVKARPAGKDPASVRNADVTKRFVFTLTGDTTCEELKTMFRSGLGRNGVATGTANNYVTALGAACPSGGLKARRQVVLAYSSDTKATSLWVDGKGVAAVQGIEAMRALWGVWFGVAEAAHIDTDLVARL